ncbi:MBL fold metallo-hydrolase [Bacillus alkalicellulosilyticus]|uniref:MBL fold metallo-hydrolase n=1 Tax=Alkalihalobacterium alkalicellulosilyticum TaxID=1912214 RepID=UPI00099666EF|nr:MBL fold metallo-hydrolase [Bacillus alkalicellulosilyticus]
MTVSAMSSKEVALKVIEKKPLFILDIRNENDFTDWKIEGEAFEYVNIPYFELLVGVETILDLIPTTKDVLVVCAKEGSSIMIADMLSDAELSVFYLEGGMKAWSEYLQPVRIGTLTNGGELFQFVRHGKGCLSYMIISNGEAAIVDATRMVDVYIEFAKKVGATITQVFDTHLHADHISGGREISALTGATYWLPPKDAEEVEFEYQPIENGIAIDVGHSSITMEALYSPGHTIGSTSFIIDNHYLLTGDILFIDSIGRPDLAGMADDWVNDLRESLYIRYRELSKELLVLPAHFMGSKELNHDGSVSRKLGTLFSKNHGLNINDENQFRKVVTEDLPPQPNAYQEIRQINMGKFTTDEETQREMEIGPNRCAVR